MNLRMLSFACATMALVVACSSDTRTATEPDSADTTSGSSSGDGTSNGDPSGSSSGNSSSSSSGSSSGGASGSSSSGAGGSSSSSGAMGSSSSSGATTSGGTGPDKPNCKYTAHKTGQESLTGALPFTTYVPANYDRNKGHTVVVILHGFGGDGVGELNAFWKAIADREELVLVAPKAVTIVQGAAAWRQADEPKVLSVMDDVDNCYNVNPKKHLLWGFSMGGNYGYLYGLRNANRFMGLAMGGALSYLGQLSPPGPGQVAWKIPFSHVHGTNDMTPINGVRMEAAGYRQAGHTFNLLEHNNGHSISAEQVEKQWNDLKGSSSP
jgi:poly(3-hydroxybutyrate) depolymerase